MSLEDIFNWIWTVNILWILLPIIALGIVLYNIDYIADNFGWIVFGLVVIGLFYFFPEAFE
jgi:hypothetical protein